MKSEALNGLVEKLNLIEDLDISKHGLVVVLSLKNVEITETTFKKFLKGFYPLPLGILNDIGNKDNGSIREILYMDPAYTEKLKIFRRKLKNLEEKVKKRHSQKIYFENANKFLEHYKLVHENLVNLLRQNKEGDGYFIKF